MPIYQKHGKLPRFHQLRGISGHLFKIYLESFGAKSISAPGAN